MSGLQQLSFFQDFGEKYINKFSKFCQKKQCCGSETFISDPVLDPDPAFSEFRIWIWFRTVLRIRDPGLGAFLTPGSGIRDGRKSASGSGIRDEHPGSYFLELRNYFFSFFWG